MSKEFRNIAIIAHVDHGKTTLVDELLKQSGTLDLRKDLQERLMDSNDLERERGITILSKNTAVRWKDYKINIVDTPGHADFGGEVERVLSMVDSVLLLVDAVEGPMPQTRFVTTKAFEMGFTPIVVINKMDRPGARPEWVIDRTFDLFDHLGASDDQLDFPIIYASAIEGVASRDPKDLGKDLEPLFEAIVAETRPPDVSADGAFQMQVSSLDYSSYVGLIGVGLISRGKVSTRDAVSVVSVDGKIRKARVLQVLGFMGLQRLEVPVAVAGDIVAISGVEDLNISDTLCKPGEEEGLPPLTVDAPTIAMNFVVNKSPFVGKSGKYLTSRQIRERLLREASHNVALRVEDTDDPDQFKVSGRGELHLSILIETMRREGFEMAVSRPHVIYRETDEGIQEPYENLVLEFDAEFQGTVMERIGERRGDLVDMQPDGKGRVKLEYTITARGLIGFQTEYRTATAGTGLMFHSYSHYGRKLMSLESNNRNGVLIASATGKALAYALFNLQDRGKLFIGHAEEVYGGQVIGLHSRNNDLTVNPLKGRQLTNVRAAGKEESLILTTPVRMSLEQSLEFIQDDELVEVTPDAIRIRKIQLTESERKRASRSEKKDA